MRKLLRFMLALIVATPTSMSLVACGKTVYPIHKKDLKALSDNLDITTLDNNINIFKIELINKLRKKSFSHLQLNDVKIIKNNDTPLQDADIQNRKLIIKIIALSTSVNFTGEKTINVNITTTQEKKDLNLLIANQNLGFIKILSKNLIPSKEELLIGIKNINYDTSILTINDFDVKSSINTTSAIIEGTGDYKGEITLSYRQELDFNIWNFLDTLVMGHMKDRGYWLENMKLNIKNNEIFSNDKVSLINLTKTFEISEQTELKNNTNLEQQLSTQEYDKEVTNTYSVTNTYDAGISEKISVPFEETTFNFNFTHSITNTNSESVTLKYPSQKINVLPHKKVNIDYDIFLNNIKSDYIVTLKLDKSSTFSGNLYYWENNIDKGWKTYNFYELLMELNINKFANNYLMYANNNELYYSIPLTLYGKSNELDVTVNPEQPI